MAGYDYYTVQRYVEDIIAQRKKSGKEYVVKKGDTLTYIAKLYNTTVDKLVEINGIKDKNKIEVGQYIKIV